MENFEICLLESGNFPSKSGGKLSKPFFFFWRAFEQNLLTISLSFLYKNRLCDDKIAIFFIKEKFFLYEIYITNGYLENERREREDGKMNEKVVRWKGMKKEKWVFGADVDEERKLMTCYFK